MDPNRSATADGTRRYRDRFPHLPGHFRQRHNLQLSSIGIGTYLGQPDSETDARYVEAIKHTLNSGVNVIDTAINYRCQHSERNIGQALAEMIDSGKLQRDEVLIATKGGFVPFDDKPPRDLNKFIEDNYVRTQIAQREEFVDAHCMSPEYLWYQIDRSLKNLGVDCIDIYYVHNPETQLSAISRAEFRKRLEAAFRFLEDQVIEGRIRFYGTATWNGYRSLPKEGNYLSLDDVMGIARRVRGINHHFRFIQLPFNLALLEALVIRNQQVSGELMSLLEAAQRLGMTTMISAPLLQSQLLGQLPDNLYPHFGDALTSDAQRALQFARSAPGVTTVLAGMSQLAHVDENIATARVAPMIPTAFKKLLTQRFNT